MHRQLILNRSGLVDSKFARSQPIPINHRKAVKMIEKAGDPRLEILARMWIDCDPNRMGGERDSGFHPDDLQPFTQDGVVAQEPRWKWFLPRAEASIKYLESHGCIISQPIAEKA